MSLCWFLAMSSFPQHGAAHEKKEKEREERGKREEKGRGERRGKGSREGLRATRQTRWSERLLPPKFFFRLSARDRGIQSRVADLKAKRVPNVPHANETQTVVDLEWRV